MKTLFSMIACLLLFACNMGPREIHYGEDSCHYCSMTIVDQQHAAQLVTQKGRAYKFDAAECLIQYLPEVDTTTISHLLVTDYSMPRTLIDARSSVFLISPNISSPMRANLSALASRKSAEELQNEKEGKLFTWGEIQEYIKENLPTNY